MNRHERRWAAAMAGSKKHVDDYVHHLPEMRPEEISKRGIHHVVFYHDDWCAIYDRGPTACNCNPGVRFFKEPKRS